MISSLAKRKEKRNNHRIERERTGTSETNGGDGVRFGVDDEELEGVIGSVRNKEAIERPLQGVSALLAFVDSDDHHRFLISGGHVSLDEENAFFVCLC